MTKKYISLGLLLLTMFLFSGILIVRGLSLSNLVKNGDSISIDFMGLILNGAVPYDKVYLYRNGFLIVGMIIWVIGTMIYTKNKRK